MLGSNKDRVGVFIDGSNLYATTRLLHFNIDYKTFCEPFKRFGKLVKVNYYTAIYTETASGNSQIRPLVDWLGFNGYVVVSKEAKEYQSIDGISKIKGNMDIEIATDMLVSAFLSKLDTIVLVSGDGDYTYVVREIQRLGIKVVMVSSIQTNPNMASDLLRRQVNEFIDLYDLKEKIRRHDA